MFMSRRLTPAAVVTLYAVFSAFWIVASAVLVATTIDDPMLKSRIEVLDGFGFVLASSALLYWLISQLTGVSEDGHAAALAQGGLRPLSRLRTTLAALFILALIVPVAGVSVLFLYSDQTEQEAQSNLAAIARIKVGEIERWLIERQGDAESLTAGAGFATRVFAWQRTGDTKELELVQSQLDALRKAFAYDAIALFNADAKRLLSVGQPFVLVPELAALLVKALADGKTRRSELYVDAHGHPSLTLVAPLRAPGVSSAPGAVVMHINAGTFLFPFVQEWPTASPSGETLLVRRDGDAVLYLNQLRHGVGALSLRLPLSQKQVPAVAAILSSKAGVITGVDYRGIEVLAAYQPVQGSDWQLIAKIDRSEALAPLYQLAFWISAIVLLAVAVVTAALTLLMRRQRYADLLVAQSQTDKLLTQFYDMPFVGMAITEPDSKRWGRFNDQLCVILGYSRAELTQKTWSALTHPDDLQKDVVEFDRVMRGESEGYSLEKRFIRKDGTVVFAEINVRCVRKPDGRAESFFATVQDITQRKQFEARAQRLGALYAALSDCNAAVARSHAAPELFEHICRIAVESGGMQMAWIGLVDAHSGMLGRVASFGSGQDYLKNIQISVDAASPYGHGPTGTAARECRALWCQDYQTDPMVAPWRESAALAGWGSSASLPIQRKGLVMGALTLYADEKNAFDALSQRLLIEMVANISFALDKFADEAQRLVAEQSLRESEARSRSLITAIPDTILVNRRDGEYLNFVAADTGALPLPLPLPPDQLLGKKVSAVLPAPIANQYMQAFARALDSGALQEFIYTLPHGGVEKHFEARVLRMEEDTVISIVRDVSAQWRAQLETAQSEERFRILFDQVITGIYVIQEGRFSFVNRRFAQMFGYDSPQDMLGRDALSVVAESSRELMNENLRPLVTGEGNPVAFVSVGLRKDGSTFDMGSQGSVATFAGTPAVVGMAQDISEKKRAEDQAARYLAQLQTAFMRTVEVATTIGEMRDPYTAGHEKRVAKIAMAIGAELGFDAQRIEGLRVAGYLHDVGKVTIPAEILSKPGKLSAVEYELIKGHAQASYDILKDVDFPWPVAQVALQHHERIDGSGYPQGLKGEAILFEARILAVADTLEAMSSHRPYRAGLGQDKALAEIERGRGISYDPAVVDACLQLFREKGYVLPT